MFSGTEVLSYALLLFLGFVYLPYTLFTLLAERSIDLGRRRDSTQLEEIVSAVVPSAILNGVALLLFTDYVEWRHLSWPFDWAVVAAMFGKDRGAISDYIYGGKLTAPLTYVGILWLVAVFFGLWFGWSASRLCSLRVALDGVENVSIVDYSTPEWDSFKPYSWWGWPWASIKFIFSHKPLVLLGWLPWSWFFHESFVPLFTWREQEEKPTIEIETTDGKSIRATLVGYEKTTDGRVDAIHLRKAPEGSKSANASVTHVYLRWSRVAEMRMLEQPKKEDEAAKKERQAEPAIGPEMVKIGPGPRPEDAR